MVGLFCQKAFDRVNNSWWLHRASDLKLPIANKQLRPFFIVSAGRSGTTLLRKKLLNSEQIHIPPESDDFIPHNAIHFTRRNKDGWNKLTSNILDNFLQQSFFPYWATELHNLPETLRGLPASERSYANLIHHLYTHVGRRHKPDLQVWGDKTPYLMYRLEWLRKIFPGARYIHVIRDGRAVVHSMVKEQHYNLERAMVRWQDSIHLFAHHRNHVSPEAVMEVKYEDFVRSPQQILQKTFNFIGVHCPEDVLREGSAILGDDVLPHHENLKKPITTSSISKWRIEMSRNDIISLNKVLRKELQLFGYKVD